LIETRKMKRRGGDMRKLIGMSVLAGAALLMSGTPAAKATLTGLTNPWNNAGSNATPSFNVVDSTDADVAATGSQFNNAKDGFTVSATQGDPNLFINNSLNNDTSFTWTAYDVSVELANPFTISNFNWFPGGTQPAAWNTPSVGTEFFNGSQYEVDLVYSGPATVPVSGTFNFGYEVSFTAGGTGSFAFTQVLTPVPEPTTFGMLAVGAMGMLARRRRNRSL
jgi:hypothetical protein